MLRLLLFRRANKVLEIDGDKFRFIDIYIDETDEIHAHTSFSEPNRIGLTNGFYFEGIQNEIMFVYVENGESRIRYDGKVYNLKDKELKLNCYQLQEKKWVLENLQANNGFQFIYKAYFFDPYEDDDETDVNFGLLIISLVQDKNKLERFINACKS